MCSTKLMNYYYWINNSNLIKYTRYKKIILSKNLKIKIYKTIILSVVLYSCETWSLKLREESRLRVFENRILRRIFWPKRDANGEWRRVHNKELNSLYRLPNIVRVIKSKILRTEEGRSAFKILTGKPTARRLLGRPRCKY